MLRGLAASALVLMVSATAWGQKVKITGTVIDNTNEPVIGASVLENGTKNGVATDLDGHFTIEVQPGARLKISYIGYKNKEVKASNGVQIMLEEESNITALRSGETSGYLDEYRRRCVTIGREVQLLWQDTKEKVTALDVDEEFGLIVRRENGTVETVRTGEVSVRGLYGYVE